MLSCIQLFATLWTTTCQAPLAMGFFRQEHWSGLPFPSPGDLLARGSKPHLLCLLHCRQILYLLNHQGSLIKGAKVGKREKSPKDWERGPVTLGFYCLWGPAWLPCSELRVHFMAMKSIFILKLNSVLQEKRIKMVRFMDFSFLFILKMKFIQRHSPRPQSWRFHIFNSLFFSKLATIR